MAHSLWPTSRLVAAAMWSLAAGSVVGAGTNLVPDASFESPLPAWFAERSGTSYYAAKEVVGNAPDGRQALVVQAWDEQGSRILSGPVKLTRPAAGQGTLLSGTAAVRSVGGLPGVKVELALFDEKGATELASFGEVTLAGTTPWQTLAKAGTELGPEVTTCRLGLVVSGPDQGGRIEFDTVGLFPGPALEPVPDDTDLAVLEAEALAGGKAWTAVEHYDGWYTGGPSGGAMLAGFAGVPADAPLTVSRVLPVRTSGVHRLWLRFLAGPYPGRFTVALRQAGVSVAEKEFCENDERHGKAYAWVWDSLEADLQAGEAELTVSRPAGEASWVTRKLDLFVLSNRLDCEPQVAHFEPAAYLRFVNTSEGLEPFCFWVWVRRHQGPRWYANPGILSRAGLSESYYVPGDRNKWLAPGQSSPWVRVNDYLLTAGGRNNVSLTATRKMHTDGFVEGRIRGRIEFAVGPERKVIRTVAVDQEAPRVLLTLPGDLAARPDGIRPALDYVRETETEVAKLPRPHGQPPRLLNLSTILALQTGTDDPELIRREVAILKALGFNQTYYLLAPPERSLAVAEQYGLEPRFGAGPALWHLVQGDSQHHPDTAKMDAAAAEFARTHAALLPHLTRAKLMDEPGGMSYEAIAQSDLCRAKFAEWLRGQGLTPEALGVPDWAAVAPVPPGDSAGKERLFYYTGRFRLEAFATLAKACVAAKNRHLPASLRTYVNYSPPTSGGSWTERGTDLFLAHRDGGLEMIWTEDWLGYSAGAQHLSDVLALARAAGRPDNLPLGAYWVGQGTPLLMRLKFYTLLAGGVRDICSYGYGPWYAGIDSWGRNFDIYEAIRDCQFEAGAIEEALAGTTRRRTDVAILYNRTTPVWLRGNALAERNAAFTHWALAHAGYDADFIPEEDIESGQLASYKVLYMDGPWLRRASAEAIAGWVRQGGVVCASAGAGSRDEYDAPLAVLDPVFGARSEEFAARGDPGRPRYETRAAKALTRLVPAAGTTVPATELDQLFAGERLAPLPGGQPVLTTATGEVAGVLNRVGAGLSLRLAALPGLAYVHEALQPPYDIESYLPTAFRPALRDLIAWPAQHANAARTAAAARPIAEVVRYDGPDRAVVFAIDHTGTPADRFAFTLFAAAGYSQAVSATGAPVTLADKGDGAIEVSLPLNGADAVVLQR